MMEAGDIGAAVSVSELAALPATSPLAPLGSSGGEEITVAALAHDALVPGTAPSRLLGPDALLALTETDSGRNDAAEQPPAGPPVERTIPSQSTHEAPNPTLAQTNIAPTAVPLAATSFELRSRLFPREAKRQRASDDDEEDTKRFSSLATAYDSSEEFDSRD